MDGEFGLVDSFGVDNGELDGLTPQECFVFGVEWQNVISTADAYQHQSLHFTVHSRNRDRLEAAMKRRNRECIVSFPHDDVSEEWMYLEVMPSK